MHIPSWTAFVLQAGGRTVAGHSLAATARAAGPRCPCSSFSPRLLQGMTEKVGSVVGTASSASLQPVGDEVTEDVPGRTVDVPVREFHRLEALHRPRSFPISPLSLPATIWHYISSTTDMVGVRGCALGRAAVCGCRAGGGGVGWAGSGRRCHTLPFADCWTRAHLPTHSTRSSLLQPTRGSRSAITGTCGCRSTRLSSCQSPWPSTTSSRAECGGCRSWTSSVSARRLCWVLPAACHLHAVALG